MLESLVRTLKYEWLQSYDNTDLRRVNGEETLDVKQRRMLITDWIGEA